MNFCKEISLGSLGNILDYASCLMIKTVLPLLTTLAVVGFVWGIIQFFLNPDDEKKKKDGKEFMLWGLITLFVMVSLWALVNLFSSTFGLETVIPQLSQ